MNIEPYLHMTVLLEKTIHSLLKRYLHKTFDCLLRGFARTLQKTETRPLIRAFANWSYITGMFPNQSISRCQSDINDGNPSESSRWAASDSTLPAWVEIDLGTPTRVNTLVLSENIVPEWATARISEFALQKWNGSAFETVFTFQGTIGDEHIFKFDTIESEKVRILISALRPDTSINSAGQTDPSLTEIELYCY